MNMKESQTIVHAAVLLKPLQTIHLYESDEALSHALLCQRKVINLGAIDK